MVFIDGVDYDPYFMLDVVKTDTDSKICSSYKKKIKKYHPDKINKSQYTEQELFRINTHYHVLNECFKEIMNTRGYGKPNHSFENKNFNKSCGSSNGRATLEENIKNFNDMFDSNRNSTPTDFGYGQHEHIQSVEEYDNFKPQLVNLFTNKKFNKKQFNKMFEYNKSIQEEDDCTQKSLCLYKTIDGFTGIAQNIENAAPVNSYNGLIIIGDEYGQSGLGYYGNNFSDYKHSFSAPRNPKQYINVPQNFTLEEDKFQTTNIEKELNIKKQSRSTSFTPQTSFNDAEKQHYDNIINDLEESERKQKETVLKYADKMYDFTTLQRALDGRLNTSERLLPNLKNYFKSISYS